MLYKIREDIFWRIVALTVVLFVIGFSQPMKPPVQYFHNCPSFKWAEGFPEVLSCYEYSPLYGYTNQQIWEW